MGKVIELKKGKPLDLTAPADEGAAMDAVDDELSDLGNASDSRSSTRARFSTVTHSAGSSGTASAGLT